MRVTSSMYYDNLYGTTSTTLSNKLFDVNKQISSGLSIQYAQDNITTFTDTMRLDNELSVLNQVKTSTENGYKVSTQSDTVLNDFSTSMSRVKTLLIDAANDSHNKTSRDAIAKELRGLESHFKNLANTSINGKYLFSGTSADIKPIDNNGVYRGNDGVMNAIVGDNVKQQYNISGAELFLGEEGNVNRTITTNVVQKNLGAKYPDYEDPSIDGEDKNLTSSDTIRDLMGDNDNEVDEGTLKHHFYISGVKSDGTAVKEHIKMSDDQSIENLLDEIGKIYGNNANVDLVNVSMNPYGEIVIEDKLDGSSKLEFSMVGAVDLDRNDNGGNDDADVTNITDLDDGERDFDKIINDNSTAGNKKLHIKEFVRSPYEASSGGATNIDGLLYDRTNFSKDGSVLTSNVKQVTKEDNSFATPKTKISEVADLSQGNAGTLDGSSLRLVGVDVNGNNYDVQIDYKNSANGGSTFSLDTDGDGVYDNGTYDIFDMGDPRVAVDADEMTYQQLTDVINMVMTDRLPASNSATDYDKAIIDSRYTGGTTLTYDGNLSFTDMKHPNTEATLSLHDVNSGDFSKDPSFMTFNSNDALEVRDPKTDFFKTLDKAIKSVEEYKVYSDTSSGNLRTVGIEDALSMIDDLESHIFASHAKIGANSNSLMNSLERTQTLETSTMTLRSSVLDTDLAQASLELTQLNLTYQAMLSTVSKVSKLSLVNYL